MSYKILIVDDDKFLLDMYALKFSEREFEVTTAENGEDALGKIEAGLRPDVYLADILMPKMDGFQLVTSIKERGLDKTAAVIILSNLGQKEDVDKGLSLGVDGYIIKASATPSEVVSQTLEIATHKLKPKA